MYIILFLALWASPVWAANEFSTITWDDPGPPIITFEWRLAHYNSNGWLDLGLKPSTPATFRYTYPGTLPACTDCWVCVDARGVRTVAGVKETGDWLSVTDGHACGQIALNAAPIPVPIPTPIPVPVPVPAVTATVNGVAVTIQCDVTKYKRIKTTGSGAKRVVTCLP